MSIRTTLFSVSAAALLAPLSVALAHESVNLATICIENIPPSKVEQFAFKQAICSRPSAGGTASASAAAADAGVTAVAPVIAPIGGGSDGSTDSSSSTSSSHSGSSSSVLSGSSTGASSTGTPGSASSESASAPGASAPGSASRVASSSEGTALTGTPPSSVLEEPTGGTVPPVVVEDEADDERPYTTEDFARIRQNVAEWDADFDPSLDPIGAMGEDDGERSVVSGAGGGVDAPHVEDLVSWTPQEKAYRDSVRMTILGGLISERAQAEQAYQAARASGNVAEETAAVGEIERLNTAIQWRQTELSRQLEQKLTGMSFDDDVSYSATPQETAALHNAAVTQLARGDYDDPATAAAIDAWRQQMAGELRDAGHRSCEEEPNQPGCGSGDRAGYFGYFASHDPAV